MFNKKAKRVIAIIGLLVMCISTMASCQVGGTYAETAGNPDLINIPEKEKPFREYTGEQPVIVIDTDDPAYKPQSNGGSSNEDDSTDGGDDAYDNGGDSSNDGSNDGGNNQSGNTGNENAGNDNAGDNNGNENAGDEEDEDDEEEEDVVKYDENNKLKIIAYNLRIANDTALYGGAKDIKDRMPRFKKVMDHYQPDVVGMSECGPEHISFLQSDYTDTSYGNYQMHYIYRAANSMETTPIMWNTDKFEALEKGTFWMSDTPDKESAATNWGEADLYRVTNWAKLKVKATGKIFVFFSTHFDFDDITHINSVNLIYKKAKEFGGISKYPFFFVGDCNMQPWGKGYEAVYSTNDLADINWELNNTNGPGTCDGYHTSGDPEGVGGGSTIDYIFYTPAKVHPLHYEVIDMMGDDGDWVSDHRGLYAEAALL